MNITEAEEYFISKGRLHDAVIQEIIWSPLKMELQLYIDDLNSGFSGLDEYDGLKPSIIRCDSVSDLVVDVDQTDEKIRIYDITCDQETGVLSIKISPSGSVKITLGSIDIEDQQGYLGSV